MNFLWYGNEINKRGKCLASWDMICKPKNQGGIGVLSLRTQNKAFLIKHLFKNSTIRLMYPGSNCLGMLTTTTMKCHTLATTKALSGGKTA